EGLFFQCLPSTLDEWPHAFLPHFRWPGEAPGHCDTDNPTVRRINVNSRRPTAFSPLLPIDALWPAAKADGNIEAPSDLYSRYSWAGSYKAPTGDTGMPRRVADPPDHCFLNLQTCICGNFRIVSEAEGLQLQ